MKIYFKIFLYIAVCIAFFPALADQKVSFFRAIAVDNASGVKELLDAGVDPNISDEKGQRALYIAMREDATQAARTLLAHPAIQIDATNAADETALMIASLRGNFEGVKLLVERGAAVNRAGWTPLHYAASKGDNLVIAKFLLDKGANIEAESPNKTRPLMMASRYGSDEVALHLLSRGADSKAVNDQNLNAAAFARLGGRDKLAARLQEAVR